MQCNFSINIKIFLEFIADSQKGSSEFAEDDNSNQPTIPEDYDEISFANVELLGRSNFLALVGSVGNKRFPSNRVSIWDDSISKAVIELEFKSIVHAVKLTKEK